MKIRCNISSENVKDIALEHNLGFNMPGTNKLVKRNVVTINKKGWGKIEAKESYIKGISMFEWKSRFAGPTRIYEEMKDYECFSIYLNMGSGVDSFIDNQKIRIKSGSHNIWSFSHAGKGYSQYLSNQQSHTLSIMFQNDYLLGIVNRYPDLLSEIYSHYKTKKIMRWHQYDIPIGKDVIQIIHQIKNADVMGNLTPMYIEGKILELFALQLNSCPSKCEECGHFCRNARDIEKMHEAKYILLNNIDAPPTIYELSKRIGINEKKLKNGFKEVFEQTIYNYLLEHKMEKASNLLTTTNKSIIDVAFECGYEYPSHFTTAFKRKFNVTPNQYRKSRTDV